MKKPQILKRKQELIAKLNAKNPKININNNNNMHNNSKVNDNNCRTMYNTSTTTTTTLAVQRPTILSSHAMRRLSFSEEDSGSNNEYSWGVETGNMEDI